MTGLAVVAFACAWLLLLHATTLSLPVDSLEQLLWAQSLQWGYYKHPPLPTWLLWPALRLFGAGNAVPMVMGAVVTLSALLMAWALCLRMGLGRLATVALFATLGNTFYNGRLDYYNHNVVLLWLVDAAAWMTWLAFSTGRMRWWAGLGLVAGLGALTKYQIALVAPSVALVWLACGGWRSRVHRRGPWVAAGLCALVFAPHGVWLVEHGFPTVHYALSTSLGVDVTGWQRVKESVLWGLDQLLNRGLPSWLLLAALIGWAARRRGEVEPLPQAPVPRLVAAILVGWGLLPVALMTLLGLLTGAELQMHWGTAFMAYTAAAVMVLWRPAFWARVPLRRLLVCFALLQALLLGLNWAGSAYGPPRMQRHFWRSFDFTPLAAEIDRAAHRTLGRSVALVRGQEAMAGTVARLLPGEPLVLIDGPLWWSPWIDPAAARGCPMAVVAAPVPPGAEVLAQGEAMGAHWAIVDAIDRSAGCPLPAAAERSQALAKR